MAISVTSKTMAAHLGDGVTVVDLWAPWCGPCQILSPLLIELEQEMPFTLLTLNVDGDTAVATEYGVQSIPTMLVFRDGRPVEKITGAYPKAKLQRHLAQLLEARHDQ
ncbi:thioredoxin family protein [Lacticaseibacillus absianus]|uniref:thioredoxin family protein n=1 Tax=Lacticaseibacillus absianus TaxID=2729623 RepID=UPI0015C6D47D|nr:thioredoxin domain-containing protein [Lacticaseibacillus absianus]